MCTIQIQLDRVKLEETASEDFRINKTKYVGYGNK